MAAATQRMPSPTAGLKSAFSPYTDSPSSPATFAQVFSNRSSNTSDHLQPPPSPYPATVDPSPVDSNGTVATEIEEDAQVNQVNEVAVTDPSSVTSPVDAVTSPSSQKLTTKLDTALPVRTRADSDDGPQSVIHAPAHFKQFDTASVSAASSHGATSPGQPALGSPQTPEAVMIPDEQQGSNIHVTHPIDTAVPASSVPDRTTPRAQTRQDLDEESKRRNSRVSVSLADIAEAEDISMSETASSSTIEQSDTESEYMREDVSSVSMGTQSIIRTMGEVLHGINETEKEVAALRSALHECWTLCNTLAKLSQTHRLRMFHYSGARGDMQEHAWRTCWRLCQQLYESRNEEPNTEIEPILILCRDFCQALFDVRQRGDEAADSVLRVSFELNNHLYNAHDRNLPEAFRERTLDFYVTLCHRLMRQRTTLPDETDSLLHACWSLAEMLFNIRQGSRDARPPDEEVLASTVQACWELCDLFREGWTQVRPDRATPRPSQYAFAAAPAASSASRSRATSTIMSSDRSGRSSSINESYHSAISMRKRTPVQPETPTTIFDDREEFSPAEEPMVPNILVLGPEAGMTRTHDRWSSAASSLSTYSDTSQSIHSSSTATAGREDHNLIRLKGLIVKAAQNTGYTRQISLPDFVRSLPSNSFGAIPWQAKLFEHYKRLVLTDPTLANIHTQPMRRFTSSEIGRSVQWMSRSSQFAWLADLYRFVFGNYPDEANQRNIIINA